MDLLSIRGDNKFIDYSEKKVLIVDDFPNVHKYVKEELNTFGISKIATATTAGEAIVKVKAQVFDAILCDYNLGGDEKDGQQALEEMRSRPYIPLSTVFIMVSAETSYQKVIAAAEYVPDDYIVKPFSPNVLRNRLMLGFAKKAIFAYVYTQTAKWHFINASAKCDEIAKKFPKFKFDALRLKGELLISMKKPLDAEQLYQDIIKEHAIPWARLGLVQSFHMQGKDALAEELLLDIISLNPEMVKCYDLLATIQEGQGKNAEMQSTLQSWVDISPKSLPRQRRLGDVALKNQDTVTAEKAYEKIVSEKYSYHFRPADMATLARSYLGRWDVKAVKRLIDNQRKFLQVTDEGKVIVSASMAEVCSRSGDAVSAKRHLEDALFIKEKWVQVDSAVLVDLVGTCLKNSMGDAAASLGKEVLSNHPNHLDIVSRLQDAFVQAGVSAPIVKIPEKPVEIHVDIGIENEFEIPAEPLQTPRNDTPEEISMEAIDQKVRNMRKDGIRFFEAGNFDGAYEKFHEAFVSMPNSQLEALNFAIIIIRILEKNGKEESLIKKWRNVLDIAKNINPENSKYQKIRIEWEKLETMFDTLNIVF